MSRQETRRIVVRKADELRIESQKSDLIHYKRFTREEPLRFDILVEGRVLVAAKALEKILQVHKAHPDP